MPAAVFLLAMLAVVGLPVYLASRHWRRDIAIAVLVLVMAPSSLLQLKAMLDVYMGITTGEFSVRLRGHGLGDGHLVQRGVAARDVDLLPARPQASELG